ncbi:MAG: LytTR family DNA-binding domain-containing protein [Bacteroidales bacterium]|nr:LytTR family DNA-binding domain-containing protein [Bacteroidales bacterium]
MTKILILEDELPAQLQIRRLIEKHYPDFIIKEVLGSVLSAAKWLQENSVDIIFMDVELSDGICFELFNMVNVDANVIITTAYESYALKAFRINSVDYLLKPVESESFIKAVEKCLIKSEKSPLDKEIISKLMHSSKIYKQRFAVKLGTRIIVVNITDIAYFYSENKSTFIVTSDKREYLSDLSLESIEEQINPSLFFKLSRSCIASISSIDSISRHFNSRLKVKLKPNFKEEILVSRIRVPQFLDWLEGVNIQ